MTTEQVYKQLEENSKKIDLIMKLVKGGLPEQRDWIPESEAADMLNWSGRWLRRQVKDGNVPILYRSHKNRNYEYRLKDIQRLKNKL